MKLFGKEWDFKNNPLLADGAWGTEMIKMGLAQGTCPEEWNVSNPDGIKKIASAYANAGSQIVLTNTFSANRIKLEHFGFGDRVAELNRIGAQIVREAVGSDVLVAGDMGSTGKMLMMDEITEEELFELYSIQSSALKDGGADLILVETMTDYEEMSIAVDAAVKSTSLPVISSMTYEKQKDGSYKTIMGHSPEECVEEAVASGASIVGANCGTGIIDYIPLAQKICSLTDKPVWIKANAGLPKMTEQGVVYDMDPVTYASYVPQLLDAGVAIVGGCCGTSPEFISEVKKVLSGRS